MDFPQLLGPYYTGFSQKAESQSCKNLYLETIESQAGRNQYAMYRSHGLKLAAQNPGKLVNRGLFELNDHLFDIQDDTIYDRIADLSIHATYSPILTDGLICSIDASLNSLFVVSANVLYRVNSGALTQPATPFIPICVGVLGGYVIAIEKDTNRFYFSRDDGATWDPLDFQTAQAYPNSLVGLEVDHQYLWLFGNRRTQVFSVGTDPNAPFVPISAGVIEMGLNAPRAKVKLDNSIFWLGNNKDGDHMVYRANGFLGQRISNHAVENAFRTYPSDTDATMAAYQLNGHSCLRLTFPSANGGLGATFEYDISTNMWFELAWLNNALNRYERHRGNCYASAFQNIVVGDYANGALYYMSPDYNSDFGYPINWLRRTPHSTQDGKRLQYKRFGLFMQTGVGGLAPTWINNHGIAPATFTGDLATLVGAATITQAQSDVLQAIYNWQLYDQNVALPAAGTVANPGVMETLGFYDIGKNPQVGMRYSNDGGEHYNAVKYRNMGNAGDSNVRMYWGGIGTLGMGRDRVWEISGSAAVKTAIVQGSFDAVACLT